ncbi:MAG: hypothetical protein WCD35_00285 [Mycobacteriales bacterium]
MFRDSRGVVHTVSSADPLEDLPEAASSALARALLVPVQGDLGTALDRCEAVRELLERWQDAFFAALPDEIDLEEEARWAAEAGLSLEEIESEWDEDEEEEDEQELPGQLGLDEVDLSDLGEGTTGLLDLHVEPDARLDEDQVAELESALLLLPLRVRLEALVAAAALVDDWTDLLADHEKLLGHLVLRHGQVVGPSPHEELADRHASLHAQGPTHRAPA